MLTSERVPDAWAEWRMPLVVGDYDTTPVLTGDEQAALATYVALEPTQAQSQAGRAMRRTLGRIDHPLRAVLRVGGRRSSSCASPFRGFMYGEMCRRGTPVWAWSEAEWHDTMARAGTRGDRDLATNTGLAAYLLAGILCLGDDKLRPYTVARNVFGAALLEQQVQQVCGVLSGAQGEGFGSGRQVIKSLCLVLASLLLLNRNPYLETLSHALLDRAGLVPRLQVYARGCMIERVRRALQHLGLLAPRSPLLEAGVEGLDSRGDATTGVAVEWAAWAVAWRARKTGLEREQRQRIFNYVLLAGRWLAAQHPEIVVPQQWTADLAQEYVAWTCAATCGAYTSSGMEHQFRRKGVWGKPLGAAAIAARLGALRIFFADVQRRGHQVNGAVPQKIPVVFDPLDDFATPRPVKRLLQPNPRDIDPAIWAKLTWAAATLSNADLPDLLRGQRPVSFYRAAALVWVTTARRSDEIRRLRVGCVRRDWVPEMRDEEGLPLDKEEDLVYLLVPVNKTRGSFYVPLPTYTAEAIEAWQVERGARQLEQVDRKDKTLTHYLFQQRNQRMGRAFLNETLIPLLCTRAGVPQTDARGAITSHRARSTIATWLRQAGVSLDDIAQFLGHTNPNTVKRYARENPLQFARAIRLANPFDRIVDGLLDTGAVAAGKPCVFYYLGLGLDARPRYCASPVWQACAHRMACVRCGTYVDADQAEALEQQDGVLRFEVRVPLLPEEKAAASGDTQTLRTLLAEKRDLPPPEPPNASFIFNVQAKGESAPTPHAAPDAAVLTERRDHLLQALAEARTTKSGRNMVVKALQHRLAEVEEHLAALTTSQARLEKQQDTEQASGEDDAGTGGP